MSSTGTDVVETGFPLVIRERPGRRPLNRSPAVLFRPETQGCGNIGSDPNMSGSPELTSAYIERTGVVQPR